MTALTIESVLDGYRTGRSTVEAMIGALLDRIDAAPAGNVWIHRLARDQVMAYAARLREKSMDELPLYGVPFAIKDNIDLAGVPTTAACSEFAYVPTQSAFVVERLIAAGAIPIGKTNLDQFATGLVGTRSPFGACENSFDSRYISGGSSSGSAVAVARGFVSFALGTDTAGSGRVPAAFNNIVGLKPSCGALSTAGVVPACRSLDCVSIFSLSAGDARRVLDVAQGFDAADAYSRDLPARGLPHALRIGIPRRDQLEFFGDTEYAELFGRAHRQAASIGCTVVELDFRPFFETARLLYEGPWVAERFAAIEEFLAAHPKALHPVTASIIGAGSQATAAAAFRAQYRLKALQRATAPVWEQVDALMVPSAGTIYRIADVLADPVTLNSNLGHYTNFVNLLDLAAIAVPAGFRSDGLPFGVTLIAPAGTDKALVGIGARLHAVSSSRLGTTNDAVPSPVEQTTASGYVHVAVCGAHMSGLPLNHQLTQRKGFLVRATRTAPRYRFYALPGGPPQRPGLVRTNEAGAAIDVEVWAVPQEHFGTFVAGIPSPLGIGKVELEDAISCSGFVCEAWAIEGAEEITSLGNWRAYLRK
ncbi:allophanate hydrolase [Povalibacter uvarum]|uniref:Allophanate hydrolase n=1 Tax=Povalibacter uvarum TaxID=732238 RepID=A0A841HFN8_9GAMM|nr:allophanate hydrolase [Povalibacter uvarum]MBB6091394.1 allophanate hydrolase [Povalibacter uvarum]